VNDLLQIIGALLLVGAFAAAQIGWLRPRDLRYLLANLVGALILLGIATAAGQPGFMITNGFWTLISLWGLAQMARGAPSRSPTA
jgi:hypothetical protein